VTRRWLPQRAGSLGLNGGRAAAAVPPSPRLIEAWLGIQQSVIDQAIDQWRVHLNACVKAKGKHFEHMLL